MGERERRECKKKNRPMETTERGEKETGDLQAKLSATIEKAKEACQRLQEQTAAAARATDRAVREHPYPAIGVAFGVGLLIGVLAGRARRGCGNPAGRPASQPALPGVRSAPPSTPTKN